MNLIDLSHPVTAGMQPFPGDPSYIVERPITIESHGCAVSRLAMGSHLGTHLDAMAHFILGGRTIEQMPLEWFVGPAALLRVPKGPGEEIGVADLECFEELLQPEARIVYETGWHRQFGSECFYTEFPSLTVDAARYLASKQIRLLGMDTPTPSREWLEVHRILLGQEIVLVESLANLDQVPDQFELSALPLRLVGIDGSPVRAVATSR